MNQLKLPLTIIAGIVALLFFQSCTRESDLTNYPVVSFTNEVQPIIVGNCAQSGCHGQNDEEFPLTSYDEISGRVEPGNGRKSQIYRVITGRALEFMPPSPSDPLTEDQIRSIFVWIEQGAQNN
ncbi:MAG: hypothetical protein KBH11_01950 [Bacteroidia bacterium]|nr:hypothetical protein [Bacteroidota bacterium]MBP9081808.1 hypothetical protein [Bacteroidia bacterium]MBK7390270.1 hypothetical protein [Bacteroidota bacterium]MBK7969969.1 hypothetical protein [Bacteroidota bacterium]MBK8415286.1 hypothetical protein [Bacteroidota bacterium]